ncbi:hypothetical protein C6A88_17800 [Mycolicibacterium austroafricanum]|nr:hypothetical protein C6A88_17800 [Mycolicibacterium austroafricanum]
MSPGTHSPVFTSDPHHRKGPFTGSGQHDDDRLPSEVVMPTASTVAAGFARIGLDLWHVVGLATSRRCGTTKGRALIAKRSDRPMVAGELVLRWVVEVTRYRRAVRPMMPCRTTGRLP